LSKAGPLKPGRLPGQRAMGCGASAAAPPTTAASSEYDDTENGHKPIAGKIAASKAHWAALNKVGAAPAPDTGFALALVADQDEASAGPDGYTSYLRYGKLTYNGSAGAASYSIDMPGEQPIRTTRGDKAGRGAEYSALEVFDGRLITADDRTGNLDEIAPCGDGFNFRVYPLEDGGGEEMSLRMGDGSKNKPLKCEWSTQKDGKLLIGSTGKERTDDDGNVVHEGEMWVKAISPGDRKIEHLDWRPMYRALRAAAVCPHGAGYMIHEGARWSAVHKRWFFLPRKLSREPYDEVKDTEKCVNLMLSCPEVPEADGSNVLTQDYLSKSELRGCSDFLFVPGTKDTHIFMTRTEESLDGVVSTFASVIDLEANCLMAETKIASERKFEGAAWVGGFGPFPQAGPSSSGRMLQMQKSIKLSSTPTPQSAFVFIKPHANTAKVQELVKSKFGDVGISIVSEGTIDGKAIDENKYIDQHYYAIASKATIMKPAQLNVPKAKFADTFSEDWDTVLAEGRVLNALDACAHLGVDADQIDEAWGIAKKAKRIVKFGGGFYCARVEIEGKEPLYTLNAFFMSMRSKFTKPDVSIHYYEVQFDAAMLAWADFRGSVLGPTDPAAAPADSLRGKIMANWEALGLSAPPNTGDNGVHASASPFEGLAEKMNWLKADPQTDTFAKALLDGGVPLETLKAWTIDPQVVLPGGDGKKGSLFDQLEDMDFTPAVDKCKALAAAQP